GQMRAHLLTMTAAVALLAAMPAQAQDATWLLNPVFVLSGLGGDFNTGGNWTSGTVPTRTAFFEASNVTSLTFLAPTAVGGFTFNAGAPAYSFSPLSTSLAFNGAGINTSNAGTANITVNAFAFTFFMNGSSAASATITNNVGGTVTFTDTSSAGAANITNNGGFLAFDVTSTAG